MFPKGETMVRKVDFFICGTQKGGTTALFEFLSRSEQISPPNPKEIHFFDDETLDWRAPNYERLDAAFPDFDPRKLRFDATPIYMFWPKAAERIKNYNENAKLIIMLRHPAFRAYSQWCMEYSRGNETRSFRAAISAVGRAKYRDSHGEYHRVNSYIQRGYYADQLARIYEHFPSEQVLVLRTDDLWVNPEITIRSLNAFLEISGAIDLGTEYIRPEEREEFPKLSRGLQSTLTREFQSQIIETQNMTGIDLSDWLSSAYREPMKRTNYAAS